MIFSSARISSTHRFLSRWRSFGTNLYSLLQRFSLGAATERSSRIRETMDPEVRADQSIQHGAKGGRRRLNNIQRPTDSPSSRSFEMSSNLDPETDPETRSFPVRRRALILLFQMLIVLGHAILFQFCSLSRFCALLLWRNSVTSCLSSCCSQNISGNQRAPNFFSINLRFILV